MRRIVTRSLLFTILLVISRPAFAKGIIEASQGLPSIVGENLTEESFVPLQARRLKDAKVVWVNFEALREMGIDVPPEGMTPEFENQILEAFAYVIPAKSDKPSLFLPGEKTFYADKYGGDFVYGSGRAAGAGDFQIKGIGRTPLADIVDTWLKEQEKKETAPVRKGFLKRFMEKISEHSHSHGGASLREGVIEPIWSEVLHRELPFDANRVVAVITTGNSNRLMGPWSPIKEPRALIVRQNSIRPAHFMKNTEFVKIKPDEENARIAKLRPKLINSLPLPESVPGDLSNYEKVQLGSREMIRKIVRKFASERARNFYQGATSPSNVEIDGKALDFGPMTALDGFPKAMFSDIGPSGDLNVLREELLFPIIEDYRATMPDELKGAIPSLKEVAEIISDTFKDQYQKEFLWRAGAPTELIEELWTKPGSRKFGQTLKRVAEAGVRKRVNTRFAVPKNPGTYDLMKVSAALSGLIGKDQRTVEGALKKVIKNEKLRQELAASFVEYNRDLIEAAKAQGLEAEGVQRYVAMAAELRNKKMTKLMRGPGLWARLYSRVVRFQTTGQVTSLRDYIEDTIEESTRTFESAGKFKLVLSERRDPGSGTLIRKVYDAKTGSTTTEISMLTRGKLADAFGKEIPMDDLIHKGLEAQFDNLGTTLATRVGTVGNRLVMSLPYVADSESIQFRWRKKDGTVETLGEVTPRGVYTGDPGTLCERVYYSIFEN